MSLRATLVSPARALPALAATIADAKGDDRLAAVTVAVPTNTCGVMARRALGRAGGIAGVDMVTLNRLAELIAGPMLAAAGRAPVSTAIVDRAIAAVLATEPGIFRPVATHPSTIVAVRRLHTELRLAGDQALAALDESSGRAREAARLSRAVARRLAADWYDEADLFAVATHAVGQSVPPGLTHVVLYLPQELPSLGADFVAMLGRHLDVRVVVQRSGDADADRDSLELLDRLGIAERDGDALHGWPPDLPLPAPRRIVSTTDADDEVRAAVRTIVDHARDGVPLERMAVLWPAQRPYARLVEHQLAAAGIRWNGRPGTSTAERLAPRLALDLLDLDRRGLRRRELFELLADIPPRTDDGARVPRRRWEQVSRQAGVARGDDWNRRLGPLTGHSRWGEPATSLRDFVSGLRDELGHPMATRPWAEWSQWCNDAVERWLGRATLDHLDDAEFRAWEALGRALDRLGHLDAIADPVNRHQFRLTLQAELDEATARVGRVGDGVTVAPLAGAVGLDVDLAVVLGAAEGVLPPRPTADPLLSERDRAAAGLATTEARAVRLQRQYRTVLATTGAVVTFPRGDLRATSSLLPSRWIAPWLDDDGAGGARGDNGAGGARGDSAAPGVVVERVASHHAALARTAFPATEAEHRLRGRYVHVRGGGSVLTAAGAAHDLALTRGTALMAARRADELTAYDGDLSASGIPPLAGPVSPTQLEAWVACPHAYFVRYVLRVRPIDEPDAEISITALDRGSAHHEILDRFHQEVLSGRLPQPSAAGWGDVHHQRLGELFVEVCEHNERRGRTGRRAFWADERARMEAELYEWLDHDSALVRRRQATVVASELAFGSNGDVAIPLADGRLLCVHGSVDRVDRTADGTLVVTDHKTGKNRYTKLGKDNPTLDGTVFQLAAYAAAARAGFGDDTTVVRAEYSLMRRGDYARPGFEVDPEADALVGAHLAHVVAGIESGFYPNLPERPGFRMFVQCEFCEPDHLGTAELWSAWQRKRHDPRLAAWFGDRPDDDEGGDS